MSKLIEKIGILDELHEPICVWCKKTGALHFNHMFSTVFQTPPRVLKKAKKLNDLLESNKIDFDKMLDETLKKGDSKVSEEIEVRVKNTGNLPVVAVVKFIPMKLDGEKCVVICFNDLSVEKRLFDKYKEQLQELKETHTQILQADKLSTLGELTAGISHEISNPLTIALGTAEILGVMLEAEILEDKRKEIISGVDDIIDALNRINSIITNMKTFLHKSEDKKEYVQLEDVINETVKLMGTAYRDSKVGLLIEILGKSVVGFVNRVKLGQVLVNLLKNSLDAVKVNPDIEGEVKITLKKDIDDNYVVITVWDNGVGIEREKMKEIFSPFYTTKEVGQGTGLGLAISQKIMESHQGSLFCDSTPGTGTLFTMKLPCLEVSSYAHNEKYLHGLSDKEGIKVLVVDNEAQVLNVFNKFLDSSDYVFIGSTNGNDALKLLKEVDIDIIVTDYFMPEMNGPSFCKQIRELGIKSPILYLTSADNIEKFNEDKAKYDVKGIILKPFTQEKVIKTLDVVLGRDK